MVETGIVTLTSYRHYLKIVELGQKTARCESLRAAAPIYWMEPIRNPRWEQKRTEGYVIVST
jgi:hypothetical protein